MSVLDIHDTDSEYRVDSCVYFCFILKSFGELSESVIGEIILSVLPKSYFEIMSDIAFMVSKGLIDEKRDINTGELMYSLKREGERIAEDMSSALDRTVREQTVSAGREVLSRKDRERSLRCDITRDRERGRYDVNVKFLNELNGETLLELKLYAPDEKKAREMRERFLAKSSFYITRIINMFLKDDYFI